METINPKELRSGNVINTPYGTDIVLDVLKDGVITKTFRKIKFCSITPILIHHEALIRLGFTRVREFLYYGTHFEIGIMDDDFANDLFSVVYKRKLLLKTNQIHELQNVHADATGFMLIYK